MSVRGAAWVLGAVAILAATRSAAQTASAPPATPTMVREWTVPSERCGTAAALDAEVARLLGGDAARRREALRVRGVIVQVEGRFELTLHLSNPEATELGSRVLNAGDCPALAEAAALLVALTVDPNAVAHVQAQGAAPDRLSGVQGGAVLDPPASPTPEGLGTNGPSSSEPESESSAEPEVQAEPEPEPEPESPATTVSARGSLFVELGTLPAPAAGVSFGGQLQRKHLRIGLSAGAILPRGTAIAGGTGPDASARFFGFLVRLSVGGGWSVRGRLLIDGAALVESALLVGASAGVSGPGRGAGGMVMLGGLGRLLVRVGRVGVGIEADLRIPAQRPTFEVGGLGDVHRPAGVLGRVGLVVRVPIPR